MISLDEGLVVAGEYKVNAFDEYITNAAAAMIYSVSDLSILCYIDV